MEFQLKFDRFVGVGLTPALGGDTVPSGLPAVGADSGNLMRAVHSVVEGVPIQRVGLVYHYAGAGVAPALPVTLYQYCRETGTWMQLGAVTLTADVVGYVDALAGVMTQTSPSPVAEADALDSLEVLVVAPKPAGAPDGTYTIAGVFALGAGGTGAGATTLSALQVLLQSVIAVAAATAAGSGVQIEGKDSAGKAQLAAIGGKGGMVIEGVTGGAAVPTGETVGVVGTGGSIPSSAYYIGGLDPVSGKMVGVMVKPASTAPVLTDTSAVVGIHPAGNAVTPGVCHTTTPSLGDSNTNKLELDECGTVHVKDCIRHVRKLVMPAAGAVTSFGVLAEGPCDAFMIDTADTIVFKQPPERNWLCVNGDFSVGTHWPDVGNWLIDTAHKKHTCTAGATTPLTQVTLTANPNDPILVGETYFVCYKLDRSAGTLTVGLGAGAGTARSASGIWVEAITAVTNGNIIFTPNASFAGSVSQVYIIPATLPLPAGYAHPISASLIAGMAAKAVPATLITTVKLQALWYRRKGAVQISANLTAAS